MVNLEADPFLIELEKLFASNKEKGSIWCYMKRSNLGTSKARRRDPNHGQFVCLVRAGDNKKKISTKLTADNYRAFSSSYSTLMRAHMDSLKKKVKQKAKKTAAATETTATTAS